MIGEGWNLTAGVRVKLTTMRSARRAFVASLLALGLVVPYQLAPEHLHEADAAHRAVVHTHVAPYHHESGMSDADNGVIWLPEVGVQSETFDFQVPWAVAPAEAATAHDLKRGVVTPRFGAALPGDVPCAVETQRQLGSRLRNHL